jgi:hypothetical protein
MCCYRYILTFNVLANISAFLTKWISPNYDALEFNAAVFYFVILFSTKKFTFTLMAITMQPETHTSGHPIR